MFNLFLNRWIANKVTVEKIDLLVKCGFLTEEEGNTIKNTPR